MPSFARLRNGHMVTVGVNFLIIINSAAGVSVPTEDAHRRGVGFILPIILIVAYKCPFSFLDWFCRKGVQRERLPLGEQVANNRLRFWYNLLYQNIFGMIITKYFGREENTGGITYG